MSAWYVLNAMGFYPVAPASCEYSVGRPIFDRVTIRPVDGKPIRITVHDNSRTNCYVARMQVDGEDRDHLFLSHDELRNGADIEIWMTSVKPQK